MADLMTPDKDLVDKAIEAVYRIKLPPLSGATDYAYLKNNNLGWVSDDQKYFEFDSEADHDKFQAYLDTCRGNRVELVAPDFKDVRVMGTTKLTIGPGDDVFDGHEVSSLFKMETPNFGTIKVEAWPEGLVIWVGGEIRWRSFDWPRKNLVDEAIESVFASDLLPGERGLWRFPNDIAVIPCGDSTIDVRKLVTLVLGCRS